MTSSSHLGDLTLLDYVCLVWVLLISTVVGSPLFKLLQRAGSYGKLHHSEKDSDSESDTDANADADGDGQRDDRKDRKLQPTDASPPPADDKSIFLHPSLYIRTSVAFTGYYAIASLWNGWLLFEADIIWNSGPIRTPLFSLLRWLASKVSPAQGALMAAAPELRAPDDRFQVGVLLIQLFLFQLHLMRRLYESVAVANFSKGSKQHASVTIMAFIYYCLCSLTPVLDSPLVGTSDSGFMNSRSSALYPWAPLAGSTIFAAGFVLQHIQHRILAKLRDGKKDDDQGRDDDQASGGQNASKKKKKEKHYSIPYGSLFRYVSMPHYLCEMIEYTGLWVFSGFKFSQFLICVWVYSNLSITAVRSHQWYKRQFPNYPKERDAVIPGIL